MTDLEKIVQKGFLKENEEIYLDYIGQSYTARIIEGGKKIKTDMGIFTSLSSAASPFMLSNEHTKRQNSVTKQGQVVNNGWEWWKPWNGTTLQEIRKKIK
jgi:hypothetical protein